MSLLDLSADEFSWMNANMKRNALSKLIKSLSVKDLSTVDVSYEMIGALSSVLLALKDADELTSRALPISVPALKPVPEQTKSMVELIKSNQKLCVCGSPKGGWDQCRDCFHKSKQSHPQSKPPVYDDSQRQSQLKPPVYHSSSRQSHPNNSSYGSSPSQGSANNSSYGSSPSQGSANNSSYGSSPSQGSANNYPRQQSGGYFNARERDGDNGRRAARNDAHSNGRNNYNRDERIDSRGNGRDNRAKPYEPRTSPIKIEKKRCECGTIILKEHFTKCYACHTAEQPVKIVKRTLVLATTTVPEVERLSVKDTCLIHFIELNDDGCADCHADDSGVSDAQQDTQQDEKVDNPDELNE
jgi:hypothetical protein